jgi:hypothetical protein
MLLHFLDSQEQKRREGIFGPAALLRIREVSMGGVSASRPAKEPSKHLGGVRDLTNGRSVVS